MKVIAPKFETRRVNKGAILSDVINSMNIEEGIEKVVNKDNKEISLDSTVETGIVIHTNYESQYTIIVKGDINGDGLVDIGDTTAMKFYIVGIRDLKGVFLKATDIDNDGNDAKAVDLTMLINYQIGLIESL